VSLLTKIELLQRDIKDSLV